MQHYQHNVKLHSACRALKRGEVIAYPTEAVWGLGCDPYDEHALWQILRLKQRPYEKGVILVAANMAQLHPFLLGLSEDQLATLSNSWPGPNTWIIPHNGHCPQWIRGSHNSLAVRVSTHPVVQALCEQFGGPIVSTPANPAGLPPARDQLQARRYFINQPLTYAPGNVGKEQQPTQIRHLLTGQIVRSA